MLFVAPRSDHALNAGEAAGLKHGNIKDGPDCHLAGPLSDIMPGWGKTWAGSAGRHVEATQAGN